MAKSFLTPVQQNPLGYSCAPNEASPSYVATQDLRTFLGFVLMMHTFGWTDRVEKHPKFAAFVQELQYNTLEMTSIFLAWLEDAELDKDETYHGGDDFRRSGAMDHPNGNGLTYTELLSDEEAAKAPGQRVDYAQQPTLRWEVTDEENGHGRWMLLYEFGAMPGDDTAAWFELDMSKTGWLGALEDELRLAKRDFAKAWEGKAHTPYMRDWLTLPKTVKH